MTNRNEDDDKIFSGQKSFDEKLVIERCFEYLDEYEKELVDNQDKMLIFYHSLCDRSSYRLLERFSELRQTTTVLIGLVNRYILSGLYRLPFFYREFHQFNFIFHQ